MKISYFKNFIISILILNISISAYPDLKQDIPKLAQEYLEKNFLNAAFVFSQGENILAQGANGVSNIDGTRLTANEVMPVASNTKSITAAAILKLQDRKLLNVNDKITKYLKEDSEIWPNGKAPSWAKEITIHNLLTHSSGIAEYFGIDMFTPDMTHQDINKKIMEHASNTPLSFTPGEKYKYSSTNFVLLGLIIEKVSGKQVGEFFKEEFFEPLEMKNTYLANVEEIIKNQLDPSTCTLPKRYEVTPNDTDKPDFEEAKFKSIVVPYADGGIISTTSDLIKWYYSLAHKKVISKKSFELMKKKYYEVPTMLGKKTYTGYGVYVSELDDKNIVIHGSGAIPGVRSEAGYLPSKELYYAIISNVSANVNNIDNNKINFEDKKNQLDIRYFLKDILKSISHSKK